MRKACGHQRAVRVRASSGACRQRCAGVGVANEQMELERRATEPFSGGAYGPMCMMLQGPSFLASCVVLE